MTVRRKYLRAADIAALTGASIRTVRRWIADEAIPSTKLGGARLVAAADLEAILSNTSDNPGDPSKVSDNNMQNHRDEGLSGKHGTRKRSIYSMIAFPNDTV
jgi:excisionase family DNA binding protein